MDSPPREMYERYNAPHTIDDLPEELLLEIFSYLSVEDLGLNVQFVCTRWSKMCRCDLLWKDRYLKIGFQETSHQLLSFLEKVPMLQCLEVDGLADGVLRKTAECCRNLRKLVITDRLQVVVPEIWYTESYEKAFEAAVYQCTRLEELTIPGLGLATNERLTDLVAQWQNVHTITVTEPAFCSTANLMPLADGCPALQRLDMSCLDWNYSDVKYFLQQKNSRLLTLKIMHTSHDCLSVIRLLSKCENRLQELELAESIDRDENFHLFTLNPLKTLTNLRLLKIDMSYGLTADMLIDLFSNKALPKLSVLQIEGVSEMNGAVVDTICSNCPLLKKLGLGRSYNLDDNGLKSLYKCTYLEDLDLSQCISLTDSAMTHVVRCKNLKCLDLSFSYMSMMGLLSVTELPELVHLNLFECNLDGFGYYLFLMDLEKLRTLTISKCYRDDTVMLNNLREKMPQVKVLFKCKNIN